MKMFVTYREAQEKMQKYNTKAEYIFLNVSKTKTPFHTPNKQVINETDVCLLNKDNLK